MQSVFLWRIVQPTKPDVRCVFLHISKRHVSLHPTSSRGHHSLKIHDSPSCVTNVITGWCGGGVAVALEPYNNVSLCFLFSTHSYGMFNCMRARAMFASQYDCLLALFIAQFASETDSVHFVRTGIRFVHIRRTNESLFKRQECEASLVRSVGSVHSFELLSRLLETVHLSELLLGPLERRPVWRYFTTKGQETPSYSAWHLRRPQSLVTCSHTQVLSECAGTYMSLPGKRLRRTEARQSHSNGLNIMHT